MGSTINSYMVSAAHGRPASAQPDVPSRTFTRSASSSRPHLRATSSLGGRVECDVCSHNLEPEDVGVGSGSVRRTVLPVPDIFLQRISVVFEDMSELQVFLSWNSMPSSPGKHSDNEGRRRVWSAAEDVARARKVLGMSEDVGFELSISRESFDSDSEDGSVRFSF